MIKISINRHTEPVGADVLCDMIGVDETIRLIPPDNLTHLACDFAEPCLQFLSLLTVDATNVMLLARRHADGKASPQELMRVKKMLNEIKIYTRLQTSAVETLRSIFIEHNCALRANFWLEDTFMHAKKPSPNVVIFKAWCASN